ncbi:MAG: tRNA uridine-5-carboxymethylaminomethyl(34) synthesis GTPase MnmE [Bacteroidales bacterium]|nr:tRNA uridine-5-carboxymethylaminomethyl(34) synthesis GTPase MnmE [Bacteroidales bacterium]
MLHPADDIICAPASGRGGAVSIVRLSGTGCHALADRVVSLRRGCISDAPGFCLRFGVVADLDEVLVSIFRAPHSYTGEDMVEISCHASPYIVSTLLERLCAQGARPAEPGEFTCRAFTSGKMDLAQAEAVADLISAQSAAAHKLAYSQLRGAYSSRLRELRGRIVELSALLELELDFSEEEVEFADRSKLQSLAAEALEEIRRLAGSFRLGNAFKRGIPVAIVGAVNSGKSTLLNALLGEERAIVSSIPGTTRDTVEELLVLKGVQYRFIDTAGLRETSEVVEQMGIERSVAQMEQASVVIVLLDGTAPVSELAGVVDDVKAHLQKDTRVIWIRSKVDLLPCAKTGPFAHEPADFPSPVCKTAAFCTQLGIPSALDVSAVTGEGLDALREAVASDDAALLAASDALLVTNARHFDALQCAAEDLSRFLQGLSSSTPTDLLSEDLRSATRHLGLIFGEITPDDVLGEVFGRFCIGK